MRRWTRIEVAALLAPTLGKEKSDALVADAALSLSIDSSDFSQVHAEIILQTIGAQPGLVGITARFACKRMTLAGQEPTSSRRSEDRTNGLSAGPLARPVTPRSLPLMIQRIDVEEALVESLGAQKAREVVADYWARAKLPSACTSSQALALLNEIANEPGIVGVVARFAKARWHLRVTDRAGH